MNCYGFVHDKIKDKGLLYNSSVCFKLIKFVTMWCTNFKLRNECSLFNS